MTVRELILKLIELDMDTDILSYSFNTNEEIEIKYDEIFKQYIIDVKE